MRYILKNKDRDILEFDVEFVREEDTLSGINVDTQVISNINILNNNLLPIGLLNNKDLIKDFTLWIAQRKIPKNRQFVENIIASYRGNNTKEMLMDYIDISFGLSLNNAYWIIPANKKYKWADYNLYDNEFNKALQNASFGDEIASSFNFISSPEYTNGMLKKCWHRDNNKIYLYKGSSNEYANGGKEAYSEYYMAQVAEILGFEYVPYDLKEFHNQIVSTCPIFTSENEGYIPIYKFIKKDLKERPLPLELIKKISLYYDLEKLQDLLVFDAIIMNSDRHLGNFGLIVDNNNNKILRPAPIFDNGLSFINFLTEDEFLDIDNSKMEKVSQLGLSFDEQLKIFIQQKRHIEGLEKLTFFKFIRHKKYNLSEKWLEPIEKYINKRAELGIKYIYEKLKK